MTDFIPFNTNTVYLNYYNDTDWMIRQPTTGGRTCLSVALLCCCWVGRDCWVSLCHKAGNVRSTFWAETEKHSYFDRKDMFKDKKRKTWPSKWIKTVEAAPLNSSVHNWKLNVHSFGSCLVFLKFLLIFFKAEGRKAVPPFKTNCQSL